MRAFGGFAATILSCLAACLPAAAQQPDVTGVWSGVLTTQDNPYWGIQDHLCFPGCPKSFHDTLSAQIADPANADASPDVLIGAAGAAMIAEREAISTPAGRSLIDETMQPANVELETYCEPYGFVREAANALPLRIREDAGNLVIDYEEFSQTRTIYMDGREPPADLSPSRLGWSSGRYEDGALIVETVAIAGDKLTSAYSPTIYWGGFADGATAVERYTVLDNPRRMTLELALTDPVTLGQPYVWTKTWLATPDVALVQDSCVDVPGQMEAAP